MEMKPLTTAEEWQWMKARTHLICCEDSQGIVAYEPNTRNILGVCVADSFSTDACNVHLAIDKPSILRRGFLNEVGRHLFIANKRERVFGLVPDNNAKAIRFNEHIGFKEVARVPQAISADIGYIIFKMDKADCRWLGEAA